VKRMKAQIIVMHKWKFVFLLIVLLPIVGYGQDNPTGNWFIYFGNKKINNQWNWHHEVQYRNFNFIGDIEQLLLRTGIGYNLSENNNNVHLGYAFIYNEPYLDNSNKIAFSEHRIYQQFISLQVFDRVSLQHRYRFEQRILPEDLKLRLRYFLAINVALNEKSMMDRTLYISAYNEIFMNTDNSYFDRNRLYGGIGYRFNKFVRTELGFLNQVLQNTSRNQLNVVAFVNI
jgi:hypothetical protein